MPITTTYRGVLIPGNEPTPHNVCSGVKLQPDSLIVLFGNQASFLPPRQQRSVIIKIGGESVLQFIRNDNEISLYSIIRRGDSGSVVARVENNEFKLLSNEDYYMERPDAYTLTVIGPDKVPVLYVKYLNRSAIEFRGIFYRPRHAPLVVRSGISIPESGGLLYSENCWASDGPIFNLPD